MNKPIVEITDLCFSYSGKEVLHSIDLSVNEKDFVAVIGPNGGGKTTLLKLVLGLLKPTRGSIKIRNRPPRSNDTTVGYVPQQIDHNLSFPATALDIVLMGKHNPDRRRFFGDSKGDRQDAMEALDKMGIGSFFDRKITDLSGGQRQRVLIARALVSKPELLVLDEPTASIDTKGQTDFYNLLKELNESLTILMVSHDLLTISSYAKSIACVNKRLHYHRMFESSSDLLDAFYSCSVEEICPVTSVSRNLQAKERVGGPDNV
jgi:zinc transport system ATP-binding protein